MTGNKQLTRKIFPSRSIDPPRILDTSDNEDVGMQLSDHRDVTLIVEDDRLSREGLRQLLAILGYRTMTARTLGEGLAKLAAAPKHVILDLMLPDGNGIDLLRQVREQGLPIKVLVTTCSDDQDLLAKVDRYQPDALMRKPIDARSLMDQLGCPDAARSN